MASRSRQGRAEGMARDPAGGSQPTEGTAERRGQRSEGICRVGAWVGLENALWALNSKTLGPDVSDHRLRGGDDRGVNRCALLRFAPRCRASPRSVVIRATLQTI